MKKYFISFILLFLFVPTVNASPGIIQGSIKTSDIIMPDNATFYHLANVSRLPTQFYPSETMPVYGGSGISSIPDSTGITISFNTNTPLVADTWYSVTAYVGIPASYASVSTAYVGMSSEGLADAAGNSLSTYTTNTVYKTVNGKAQICYNFDNCQDVYLLNYVFKSYYNGSKLSLPYTTGTNCSGCAHAFYGYSIESLGYKADTITTQDVQNAINNSGLATANGVNELKTSINQVKQEMSGMQQEQKQTNKKLDDLNDNITSEEQPDIDLELDESSNTPISDLILFPITLLNKLINTIGDDTCSPYTLPFFYDTTVTFPCFQLSNYLGTSITNSIDLFICLFMCYNLAMLFISIFEDITSLRDTYDGLYEPKHADTGYKPKHGKE